MYNKCIFPSTHGIKTYVTTIQTHLETPSLSHFIQVLFQNFCFKNIIWQMLWDEFMWPYVSCTHVLRNHAQNLQHHTFRTVVADCCSLLKSLLLLFPSASIRLPPPPT